METADLARLRQELQEAYASWLRASQRDDFREAGSAQGKSASGPTVKELWASYLGARERLNAATAGQPPAGKPPERVAAGGPARAGK